MFSLVGRCVIIGASFLIISTIGLARPVSGPSICVNNVAELGNCNSGKALTANQSFTNIFSYDVKVNGDPYNVYGNYTVNNSSANGPTFIFNASAKYLGTTPTRRLDVLHIDFAQRYLVNPSYLTGWYDTTASGTLSGNAGAGSFWEVVPSVDKTRLGTIGPFGIGTHSGGAELYFGPGSPTHTPALKRDPIDITVDYTYDFRAGTDPGAGGTAFSAATPEPAETLPIALAFVGIISVLLRKRVAV
ncbi:MAG: hypothetical protein JOY54_21440 [Acidobacteriaceae bacterium]|nr:hypothetical protein [Acidobacteriaceae bacterium]